jgi:hypothetical protein
LGSDGVAVEFPKEIQENFLKIVTNIFYLTAYKTWTDFKGNYLSENKIPVNVSDTIYQKHLKEIRKQVYKHFAVPKGNDINSKYLVRLYPYSLPKTHPTRVEYTKASYCINTFLDHLNKKIIPSSFLSSDTDPSVFSTIEDVRNIKFLFFRKLWI